MKDIPDQTEGMNHQSKTPRIDEVASDSFIEGTECVLADFARQLEIELTAAKKETADWLFNAQQLQKQVNILEPENQSVKSQLEQAKKEVDRLTDAMSWSEAKSHEDNAELRIKLEQAQAAIVVKDIVLHELLEELDNHVIIYDDGEITVGDLIQSSISPTCTDDFLKEVQELRRDKERLEGLRSLMGYVQAGEGQSVKLFQDDTTFDYFVVAGKKYYFDSTFKGSIDSAIAAQGKGVS